MREMAINLVREVIPEPSEDKIIADFQDGFPVLNQLGLVGLHDFRIMAGGCWFSTFRAFQRLNTLNELPLLIWMLLPGERLDQAIDLGLRTSYGKNKLRIGQVKYFFDGSQGVRTAWMLNPYEDSMGVGMQLIPIDEMTEKVKRAHLAGLSVAVHAIGCRANREMINIFEQVLTQNKAAAAPSAPHRIKHVQNIQEEDIFRLGSLNVTASVQPIHATETIPMIEKAVESRANRVFPFKELLDAGVPLALGSDSPVADPNPFWGIRAAVTHQTRDGTPRGGWCPDQCLSLREAIWGYTMGSALASGQERQADRLTPGKLVDFIVLDRNIFNIPPMEIAETQVEMTVVGDQITFRG